MVLELLNNVHYFLFFLCTIIDMACCMAIVFTSLKVCLMIGFRSLNLSSRIFIEGI